MYVPILVQRLQKNMVMILGNIIKNFNEPRSVFEVYKIKQKYITNGFDIEHKETEENNSSRIILSIFIN